MAIFKCKMCGGTLEINNESVATCEYCGTQQTLPKLSDDRRANLYDRANHFRRNNEFDKAMGIYEQILNEDNTDAESYWSLVLCRYGIEYVEDPSTRKRVPTVNRAQFTSIFDDDNYKSALQYADGAQRHLYEEEAKAINEIQKGILAISQKEEPFDVFICYKETDRNGRRTPDSVLANELYHQLTQEGFKVFFSRITLEDKLGVAYEPYIFAALNSAKVMVVLGTKPEYFNAVWVKNEWSRYLALIRNGANKILIPAYRDMDPYDLPDEFSHLQAQDMSKLGFMQDLIRGIKKIAQTEEPKQTVVKETVIASGNANTAPLLKRAFMFLEDGDWNSANEYCEKVLDIDPECAQAYLGKLMAELRVCKQDELKDCTQPFDGMNNYQKTMRFADGGLRVVLIGYIDHINERNEQARMEGIYQDAYSKWNSAKYEYEYKAAAKLFDSVSDYRDSATLAQQCYENAEIARKDAILSEAKSKMANETVSHYETAKKLLEAIRSWKDADGVIATCESEIARLKAEAEAEQLRREQKAERARMEAEARAKRNKKIAMIVTPIVCAVIVFVIILITIIIPNNKYTDAVSLMDAEKYIDAIAIFEALDGHKDSQEMISQCYYRHAMVLLQNEEYGKALSAFIASNGYSDADTHIDALWDRLAARATISSGYDHVVGIKNDGTVVAMGENKRGQCEVMGWNSIVAVYAGGSLVDGDGLTVALKEDGTVVATSDLNDDIKSWTDIVSVYANDDGIIALKRNGIPITAGYISDDVDAWTDIVAVGGSNIHTIGLKMDGTVIATGDNTWGQCNTEDWTDIVAICAGADELVWSDYESAHTVGLKEDGTVIAIGGNKSGQCNVTSWSDIIAIATSKRHTVGLKKDGTVVAVGDNNRGQCNTENWTDIVAITVGNDYTIGLKSDGTIVAVGSRQVWTDIVAISAGGDHTVGLKKDGTVVAVGDDGYPEGRLNVENWTDIIAIDAGECHTVGLKADGTVVAVGNAHDCACDVENWTDIVNISTGGSSLLGCRIIGLTSDDVVVTTGDWSEGQCNVWRWTDMVALSAEEYNSFGLKADGTVVATKYTGSYDLYGQDDVGHWKDIIAISAGERHTVGLKKNGTVVATKFKGNAELDFGQCRVDSWRDIVAISAGHSHTVGLKADGTVVAVGYNVSGKCDVGKWRDIVAISAGDSHTVGLKADGTVVAVGSNTYGQCNVEGWKDIKVPD